MKGLSILKYKYLSPGLSLTEKSFPATVTIVGVAALAGIDKRVTRETRLKSVPYSETARFLLIAKLNRKLKKLAKIPPVKIKNDPDISGCVLTALIFFRIN